MILDPDLVGFQKKWMACKWSCWVTMSDGRSWGSESWGHLKSTSGSQLERKNIYLLEPGNSVVLFQQKVVAQPIVSHFDVLDVLITHSNLWCILWYNYHIATCRFHHSTVVHMFLSFSICIRLLKLRPLWIGGFAQPTKPTEKLKLPGLELRGGRSGRSDLARRFDSIVCILIYTLIYV